MQAVRSREYRRVVLALVLASFGELVLAAEEAPAPNRSAFPASATGSPSTTLPSGSRGERWGTATAAPRPGAARESGSSRPRRLLARWLRRIQATPSDRAPAGRAAAPERETPPAIVQPSSPGAPEVSGI